MNMNNSKNGIPEIGGSPVPFSLPFWVISDTHFFHKNIVEYEPVRKTLAQDHNQVMVDNWNNRVENQHTVLHLGDLALGQKQEFEAVAPVLQGKKFIVLGNHDKRAKSWYQEMGFCIVPSFVMDFGEWKVLFSHYPDDEKKFVCYPKHLNVHGHVHSKTRDDKRLINVSVEVQNFQPQSIETLVFERINDLKA